MARPDTTLQITLLTILSLSFIAGEIFGGTGSHSGVFMIEGILCMVINAVLMLPLRRKYASKEENVTMAPLLYVILMMTAQDTMHCTPLLAASILVTISILSDTSFSENPEKMELFFFAILTLEAAAIFWTPALWMAIPYLISGIVRSEDKLKLAASAVIGILAPVVIYLAIAYLNDNLNGGLAFISSAVTSKLLSLPAERSICFSMPTLLKYFVVAVAVTISILRFFFKEKPNIRTLLAARTQLIILFPALIVICVAFYGSSAMPSTSMLCPLTAMFLNDYLEGSSSKEARLYLALITVILISERINTLNINPF